MTVQEQIDDLYRAVWFAIGIATSACAVSAVTGAAVFCAWLF